MASSNASKKVSDSATREKYKNNRKGSNKKTEKGNKKTEKSNKKTEKGKKKVSDKGKRKNVIAKKSATKKNEIKWSKGGETIDQPPFVFPENVNNRQGMRATDYFELFFDDTLLEIIIKASSEYCVSKNWPDINLNKGELRAFFAILILSGYNQLPGKPMYWSSAKDLGNEAVSETMRRDRFDDIMKSLHFISSENLDANDKFAKLRPVISYLQKKFMQHFSPTEEAISHDEAMVEYFGNHGCKQAIRNKPIRFGYKAFCQNTPAGYLICFEPYQGKTYNGDEETEQEFGKCASSLLHLLDSYPLSKSNYPYHFYCDNYFTTVPLLVELKNRGYNCTGTIKANRLGKDCPLTNINEFKKQQRGYKEVVTANFKKTNIFLNRWKDNAAVTVASTCYAGSPEGSVTRWCKNVKKRIDVPIPHAIQNYNRNMGGTDRTDQNINNYRISIRGKKWWWALFTWMLDASVQNAWSLARKRNSKLTQLRFRRNLVNAYLTAHKTPRQSPGRKRHVSENERLDRIDHFPRKTVNNKQRRCAGSNCKSTVRTECAKCNVGLCIDCFIAYHTTP